MSEARYLLTLGDFFIIGGTAAGDSITIVGRLSQATSDPRGHPVGKPFYCNSMGISRGRLPGCSIKSIGVCFASKSLLADRSWEGEDGRGKR